LHIETLDMMTKYQLVFVRLEAAMKRIVQNDEAKKRLRLKRGFQAFKNHSYEVSVVDRAHKKQQLVCSKFELSIQMMCAGLNRYYERTALSQAFRKLHDNQ
jgi:predicted site-specific integrase-resolvase